MTTRFSFHLLEASAGASSHVCLSARDHGSFSPCPLYRGTGSADTLTFQRTASNKGGNDERRSPARSNESSNDAEGGGGTRPRTQPGRSTSHPGRGSRSYPGLPLLDAW